MSDKKGVATKKKRKRRNDYDLRDYWPWFEKTWTTGEFYPAENPPFELADIHRDQRGTRREKRWRRIRSATISLLFLILALWLMIWGAFVP